MKQLYKIVDGLLNINDKIECPLHNESFANFCIDKINKICIEISLIDKLKKPTCISEAIPIITSIYIERLIRHTHLKLTFI